jgi:ribonuclease HI
MAKNPYAFYVVWVGHVPGIYKDWLECKEQINGYPKAKYKGFKSKEEAEKAFSESHEGYTDGPKRRIITRLPDALKDSKPVQRSISVDGAWNTATGYIEYRGVITQTGQEIFHVGPLADGTNNLAEFLAIVHGLAYCKQRMSDLPIYSDSYNAIKWVKLKKIKTTLVPSDRNEKLFELLERALKWLEVNEYSNEILKWETQVWGENPADFGRK